MSPLSRGMTATAVGSVETGSGQPRDGPGLGIVIDVVHTRDARNKVRCGETGPTS
jgi:hypothetical protein